MCSSCCIVESDKEARWATFFYEITHRLIVKVSDRRPFDMFSNVFLLFSFECQLNEDLLELLVDVVDAQLFEAIILSSYLSLVHGPEECINYLEHLETIDIQDPNGMTMSCLRFHRFVDMCHYVFKEVIVDGC